MSPRVTWALIGALCIAIWVVFMAIHGALAHVPDHPEFDRWAMSLRSKQGLICCNHQDAYEVEEWDYKNGHYRILLDGAWLEVPDDAVLNVPNQYGRPLAWIIYFSGIPQIRCFLAGSGS